MSKIPFNKEKAYAVVVGIGNREVDSPAMGTTASDAERIGKELIARTGMLPANVQYLLNNDATAANLLARLDALAAATKVSPAEMVIVYFSGHGCVKNGKYYLVARDTVNTDIENTGIAGSVFVDKLQAIQTDKMLILLDCCHSGGIYDPVDVPFDKELLLSKANRVVISASHSSEVSYLSRPLSIFTYALVEGLAGKYFEDGDTEVTLFGLAMYVRERVYPLSENKQRPQLNILQNAQTSDFSLARYPNGEPRPAAFPRDFSLLNGEGKDINTGMPIVKDAEYRQQYAWMISGNDNVVVANVSDSTITINKGNTTNQTADKIYNIDKIDTANFS